MHTSRDAGVLTGSALAAAAQPGVAPILFVGAAYYLRKYPALTINS
jgi:hypothetical protein